MGIPRKVEIGQEDEDVMKALELKGDIQNTLLESLKVRIKKYQEE